ncbi:MAG: FGGY-family carbohydrate kinase [Rhizobiales bacterium]|nr:FGGY-family carbohydrate kinase [Hyphomicrobiales bacterium]MBO6698129.1 FGGY-family carbohydrate kinase [Hyphomicrobiales bacterium]MBO6735617.1 FGGY-family carbohydrate kinase [Hyphomicrobiales bacterium]MBO6910575.1 FGGY-family carbohydrate kinase [Hyphomicrobiales bacterium]MBO6957154.1 FGGY-family carbohydrate kinase [Hyphomicrobiales bacterium]
MTTYSLGVDIGTFESKGVLVDESGAIVAQAARPHQMIVPQAGWAEHRPDEDWWGDFVHITKALLAGSGVDPKAIKAVATSAIGPCMLPVDADGAPLMNGVLYGVDTRAAKEIDDLNAELGEDAILEHSGNALTSQAVGPKILWFKRNHPELWAKTHKILTATSYLTFKLTDRFVIDHYTAPNSAPLYDIKAQTWSDALGSAICSLDMMPELMWSTEIAGTVTAKAAAETGLAEGTPVTCGTIDAAAEAVSVGTLDAGDMMMMYGSTIFIITVTESQLSDPRLWHAPWLFEGEYAAMAGLATSGTLTHWFRDQFAKELSKEEAFPVLAAEAANSPPGAKGLLCLPYFSGERTPIHDPMAKGAVFGLDLTHTRGDLYRAVIEGIAMGTRHVTETYAEAGQVPKRLLAVGGGTKNELWLQATSDLTGLDQIVCSVTTGASYGNAFLARLALGEVTKDDLPSWNPAARTVKAGRHEAYEAQYPLFKALYEQTKDIAHRLGDKA